MFFLILLGTILLFFLIKSIIILLVWKFGKISYDGFSAAGFKYDPYKDLFYSTRNAWQKSLGYSRIYDVLSPFGRMTLDALPILFQYQNESYLIEFWKGQYGIVTGAEIGVYKTNDKIITKNTLYEPTNKLLPMAFTLYYKQKELLKIKDEHWWLAAFKLGFYSNPKDLTMDISVTFPNKEMLSSFLDGFSKHGYTYKDYKIIDTTFYFLYQKPKSKKVWTRTLLIDLINAHMNKKNVMRYNNFLNGFIDKDLKDDSLSHNRLFVQNVVPDILQNKEDDSHE